MDYKLPKGKRPGWIVGKEGIKGEGKKVCFTISMYNVGGGVTGRAVQHREDK